MEKSWPFWAPAAGNTFGKTMSEDQWAEMFRYVLNTGVMAVNFQDMLNELIVTPGSVANTINVDTGAAFIQGHIYINDSICTLGPIVPPVTGTRADLIVLELKWGLDAGITAKIIEGTTNAIWPVGDPRTPNWMPAQPIATYGVKWQLPLAQVNVTSGHAAPFAQTDIVDWRAFTNAGGAKSSTYVVAAASADPTIRANADAVIPYGSVDAEWIINQAILQVSAYGGGTVQLSEGTFPVSDTINLVSNVNLAGLGNNTRIVNQVTTNPVIAGGILGGAPVNNVTIKDMAISGGGPALVASPTGTVPANNATGEGISISEGTNVTIRNCQISNCTDSGIVVLTTDSSGTTSYGMRVQGCDITNCAGSGILVEGNSGIYSDNQVYNNSTGIKLNGTGTWGASMNNINNNTVRFNLGNGIVLNADTIAMNCSQNIVSGNLVANNGMNSSESNFADIYLSGYAAYNTVTSNTVQSWANVRLGTGIWIDSGCTKNSVTNNECYDGVYMTGQASACPGIAAMGATTNNSPNWIRRNHSLCHCGGADDATHGYDW